MYITRSGAIIVKPKENEKQIREEIFQKLLEVFDEYLTPKNGKRIRRGLKKTSKILAGAIKEVKKKDKGPTRIITKYN